MNNTAEATAPETTTVVFEIPEHNMAAFEAKFAKLTATAQRLNCEAPQFEVLETVEHDVTESLAGQLVKVGTTRIHRVTVTGEAPSYKGWSFVAVVDFSGESTTVFTNTENFDLGWWKLTEGYCDHCETKRQRNKVVVVEHETEGRKVVGTTCLRDFLGHVSPEHLASYAEMIFDLDEFGAEFEDDDYSSGRHVVRLATDDVLAVTVRVITVEGWKPKSACTYGGRPTSTLVRDCFDSRDKDAQRWAEENPVQDSDRTEALAARDWARNLTDTEAARSDYLMNLRAVNTADSVEPGKLGFLCSTVAAFRKDQERAVERAARAAADAAGADSVHFGEEKERLVVTATVTFVMPFDGDYGTTTLVKTLTDEGNVVVWWSSGTSDLEAGDRLTGKATVKKHETRDGVAQTVVNRWSYFLLEDGETVEEGNKRDAAERKAAKAAEKEAEARRAEFRAAEEAERVAREQRYRLFVFMAYPHRFTR